MPRQANYQSPLNAGRLREVETLLRQRAMSMQEMSALMGVGRTTLSRLIDHYKGTHLHIGCYRRTVTAWIPVYSWGPGVDVAFPIGRDDAMPSAVPRRIYGYKPQPVQRDWSVQMVFGAAA